MINHYSKQLPQPIIRMGFFVKDNIDMNIKLNYKPHDFQKQVHNACKSDATFITVVAGRQIGKSHLSQFQAIIWALSKKCNIMVVSPTYSQSKKFSRNIVKGLKNANLVKSNTNSTGNITLELLNGSRIDFKTAQAKDNLRGESIDYIIIDEAAFIDKTTVDEVLLPMLITRPSAKILSVTTPKGKNWIYEWYLKGQDISQKKYWSIKGDYTVSPYADFDLIETFKANMATEIFEQEFLAKFVDAGSVFGSTKNICILKPSKGQYKGQVYVGIDIGMKNDYTVVSVLDENCNMIDMLRFTGCEVQELISRINTFLSMYNTKKIYIEENNQGLPIMHLLKPTYRNKLVGFKTTATSKPEIINNMITLFSTESIKVLDDKDLKNELESFVFKYNAQGRISFQAASGGHDDIIMSLAIAIECYNKSKNSSYKMMLG